MQAWFISFNFPLWPCISHLSLILFLEETYLLGLKFSKNSVCMGNFRTDVSGLAKLQVKKTDSYFGKREAILMIDELSLFECKQVVHE